MTDGFAALCANEPELAELRGSLSERLAQQMTVMTEQNAQRIQEVRGTLEQQLAQLPVGPSYVVICASGARSGQACRLMRKLGHVDVYNVTGGMAAWMAQRLPVER